MSRSVGLLCVLLFEVWRWWCGFLWRSPDVVLLRELRVEDVLKRLLVEVLVDVDVEG